MVLTVEAKIKVLAFLSFPLLGISGFFIMYLMNRFDVDFLQGVP